MCCGNLSGLLFRSMRFPIVLLQLVFSLIYLTSPVQGQIAAPGQELYDKAERYFIYGRDVEDRYEKTRYMDYAIVLFKNYLDLYPNGTNAANAHYHMGFSEQSIGRIDDAERIFKNILSRYRRGNIVGLAANKLALLSYTEQDWKNAAKYFDQSAVNLSDQELRFSALSMRLKCLRKIGTDDLGILDALSKITTAKGHPHASWAQFMIGYQYYQMENFEKAIEILQPLTIATISNIYRSQAIFYTGLSAVELGRGDDAQDYLYQVLDVSLTNPSLTQDQRRKIAHNKAMAQTGLMSLFYKKEEFNEVIDLFRKGNFGATGRTEARRSMTAGKSFYRLKRFRDARSAFRRVDQSIPNTPEAFDAAFHCLECDYQLRQPDLPKRVNTFLELYGERFSVSPNLHMAAFLKAETLYNLGEFEASANAFSEIDSVLIPRKRRSDLLFKRGWCQAEIGDNHGATRNFTEFTEAFPDDPRQGRALAKRAQAYSALGDRMSSLRDYEALLKLETDAEIRSFALQGSARVLREEKKIALMVERYRRLLAEFDDLPTDTMANANYWIGWGFFKLEKYDDARPYLEKSQEMIPEFYNEPAGNILVLLLFSQGKADDMNEVLRTLLSDYPSKNIPKQMLTWLGVQLFHGGHFTDSVRYLESATDPDKPKATEINIWRTLTKGQNELNQYQEALQSAEIVLLLETEERWKADSQLDIAQALLGLSQPEEARKAAQAGLDLTIPGAHNAGLHLVLGRVDFIQKMIPEALAHFETTLQIAVDDPAITPEALYWGAQAAEKLGDNKKAISYRSKQANQFPSWLKKELKEHKGN